MEKEKRVLVVLEENELRLIEEIFNNSRYYERKDIKEKIEQAKKEFQRMNDEEVWLECQGHCILKEKGLDIVEEVWKVKNSNDVFTLAYEEKNFLDYNVHFYLLKSKLEVLGLKVSEVDLDYTLLPMNSFIKALEKNIDEVTKRYQSCECGTEETWEERIREAREQLERIKSRKERSK